MTSSRRTKAYHHYSVGGELHVENEVVLEEDIESVECRWCGPSAEVVTISSDDAAKLADAVGTDGA